MRYLELVRDSSFACHRFAMFETDVLNVMKLRKKMFLDSYPKRIPENSRLDIDKSIREQFNMLRVSDNERYPLFFSHMGHEYILKVFKKKS